MPVTFVLHNGDPIDHEWIVGDAAVHERHRAGTEPVHGVAPDGGDRSGRDDGDDDGHLHAAGRTCTSATCPATRPTAWSARIRVTGADWLVAGAAERPRARTPAAYGRTTALVQDRRQVERLDPGRQLLAGRQPQAVDRGGSLDQGLQGRSACRPARDERMHREREQPADLDDRVELLGPRRADLRRPPDRRVAREPGHVVVAVPVIERPVHRQLDQGRRSGPATSQAGTGGPSPSGAES